MESKANKINLFIQSFFLDDIMLEAQQDLDFLTLSILVGVIFLLAGTIKGILGVGLPTTSVSVMALFLPPKVAIALVVFPILVTNFRQFFDNTINNCMGYRGQPCYIHKMFNIIKLNKISNTTGYTFYRG